ncbi:MAG: cytochrome c oxidase assembly protein [Candidatus Nanopelagicales bacterium]
MTVRQASTPVTAPTRPQVRRAASAVYLWLGVGAAVAAVAAVATSTHYSPAPDGLPDSGRLVVDGITAMRLVGLLAGALCAGFILSGFALDTTATTDQLGREGRRDLRRAAVWAWVWALSSAAYGLFALADVLGVTLGEAAQPSLLRTYAWDVTTTRAAWVAAVMVVVMAARLPRTRSLAAAAGWFIVAATACGIPSLAGHAAGLGSHSLALVAGFVHTACALTWGGGGVALGFHAARGTRDLRTRMLRFGFVAVVCVALLGISGVASAATRMDTFSQLWSTTYGRMILAKTGALGLALGAALASRRWAQARAASAPLRGHQSVAPGSEADPGAPLPRWALPAEIAALAAAVGIAAILARAAFPRTAVDLPSLGETLIGYLYPPAPTLRLVALGWHPDWVWLTTVAILAGLYGLGLADLHRRGDRWPVGRTVSWFLGLGVIVWATSAGIGWYAPVSFAMHMIAHMALSMFAPVFLVMGAPVTLALRALPAAGHRAGGGRGPREWLLWGLHTPLSRFLTHPLYVLFIYTVGLYGLYYTPAYAWLMTSHLGHLFMQVHFLLAGYLFYWVVIGIDPTPRRLDYPARLILLMASLVIHTFFAVPMMMAGEPMIQDWFAVVQPPWLTDPLADTHYAGGIAWGLGEIPTLVVALTLGIQWARSDDREARRLDRRAEMDGDADLTAYNAGLAKLDAADRREN